MERPAGQGGGGADVPPGDRALVGFPPAELLVPTVTVEYEKSLRRRQVGETADSGFQIGVQRTLPFPAARVWELPLSPRGLAIWLGRTGRLRLAKGARYRTREGASGELRALAPGSYLRLSWQPPGWDTPSIVALRLLEKSGRTAVQGCPGQGGDAGALEKQPRADRQDAARVARPETTRRRQRLREPCR